LKEKKKKEKEILLIKSYPVLC